MKGLFGDPFIRKKVFIQEPSLDSSKLDGFARDTGQATIDKGKRAYTKATLDFIETKTVKIGLVTVVEVGRAGSFQQLGWPAKEQNVGIDANDRIGAGQQEEVKQLQGCSVLAPIGQAPLEATLAQYGFHLKIGSSPGDKHSVRKMGQKGRYVAFEEASVVDVKRESLPGEMIESLQSPDHVDPVPPPCKNPKLCAAAPGCGNRWRRQNRQMN